MVSPAPNAVPNAVLVPVEAPESVVNWSIAGVAAAERVTVVVAAPPRPSLVSVADNEPARLISAVALVVRLILPPVIEEVPTVASSILLRRKSISAVLPAPMPIDRLLLAIEPVVVVPALNVIVLLLTIR